MLGPLLQALASVLSLVAPAPLPAPSSPPSEPPAPAPVPLEDPAPELPPAASLESTAYCLTGRMANGSRARMGAVAGNRWSLGTRLWLEDSPWGPGVFVVEDRIGWGSELDFAMPGDCIAARAWGRRTVRARIA